MEKPSRKNYTETSTIKVENNKGEVLAFYNLADFEWVRFKGKNSKILPYPDAIIKLIPNTIFGLSKCCDCRGNYMIIIPSFKKFPLSLENSVAKSLRSRSKPYTGNVSGLFHK